MYAHFATYELDKKEKTHDMRMKLHGWQPSLLQYPSTLTNRLTKEILFTNLLTVNIK